METDRSWGLQAVATVFISVMGLVTATIIGTRSEVKCNAVSRGGHRLSNFHVSQLTVCPKKYSAGMFRYWRYPAYMCRGACFLQTWAREVWCVLHEDTVYISRSHQRVSCIYCRSVGKECKPCRYWNEIFHTPEAASDLFILWHVRNCVLTPWRDRPFRPKIALAQSSHSPLSWVYGLLLCLQTHSIS
jgi:hypothetical protein